MTSKIEKQIEEIEDYLEGCQYKKFSKDEIIVNREQILSMLDGLRDNIPDEIARYQQVLDQKDQIFADARAKAENLIRQTTEHMNQQINEETIMKQAYDQANQMVNAANAQAQGTIGKANAQAEETVRQANAQAQNTITEAQQQARQIVENANVQISQYNSSVTNYLDEKMAYMEQTLQAMLDELNRAYTTYSKSMGGYLNNIRSDRGQLANQMNQNLQKKAPVQNPAKASKGGDDLDVPQNQGRGRHRS